MRAPGETSRRKFAFPRYAFRIYVCTRLIHFLPKNQMAKSANCFFFSTSRTSFWASSSIAAVRLRPQSELITKVGPACKSHKRKHTHIVRPPPTLWSCFWVEQTKTRYANVRTSKSRFAPTLNGAHNRGASVYCIVMSSEPSSARAQLHYCGNQHFSNMHVFWWSKHHLALARSAEKSWMQEQLNFLFALK